MANYLDRGTAGQSFEQKTPIATSGGATDASKIVQTGADGRLHSSLMPAGIGADTLTLTASGALTAGDLVYVTSAGKIARATAAAGAPQAADGFVLAASADLAQATIYFEGLITGLTGLTVGGRCYLSDTTPGGITQTPVSGTGKIHQYIGKAVSASSVAFEADDSILLA